MRATTDVPAPLEFVNPDETDPTYRAIIFAAPGQGKSCAAASAPTPILVVSADRPSAYRFARKLHGHTKTTLQEVRYAGPATLGAVTAHLRAHPEIKTVVLDPMGHIVDSIVDVAPANDDGGPNYQWVNKQVMRFLKELRSFDVNVVLVAHEKVNDGKKGDGGIYPQIGGMTLVNKAMAEMDIVAHIERVVRPPKDDEDGEPEQLYVGQLLPVGKLRTKDGTGVLGDRRVADLSRWFQLAAEATAPDMSDVPFAEDYVEPAKQEELS